MKCKWTPEEHDQKSSVSARRSRAPVVCFAILTCLNALFWFTADFGSFVPPSEGVLRERFFMFGVTEAGPLAFFMLSMGMDDYIFAGVVTTVILVLGFLSACVPKKRALVVATCIGVFVWFFLGFCVAGLRIT